ncbi:MAG: hypothetical protein IJ349_03410 [Clostridia bacterium]|nr:hypothetical protein [Clostridia bacterium]
MKKKAGKIILSLLSLFLVAVIAFFANAFFGNPVSKALAKNAAEKYLVETYSDCDFEIDNVYFNFKSTNYNAHVISPSSVDSEFSLVYDMLGNLLADSYESSVTQRGNTSLRLTFSYREAVDAVLGSGAITFADPHIGFGDIEFVPSQYKNEPSTPAYALVSDELELDKEYDIKELAKKAGHLTIYVYDETVTVERLAEMLLELRDAFDKADLPFYVIDFVLEYPRSEDGTQKEGRVEVMNFLYDDIYEKGLTERVAKSNQKAIEYYEQQDTEKLNG